MYYNLIEDNGTFVKYGTAEELIEYLDNKLSQDEIKKESEEESTLNLFD